MWRGGFYPSGQILSSAIAAIDLALWDIKGKALGVPTYQLLGGLSRDKVLTYTHLHGTDAPAIEDAALHCVAEGWRCLRWEAQETSTGQLDAAKSAKRVVEHGHTLRSAVGEHIELCVDLHTKFSAAEATRICRELEPIRPLFVEDPVRSENPLPYRRTRHLHRGWTYRGSKDRRSVRNALHRIRRSQPDWTDLMKSRHPYTEENLSRLSQNNKDPHSRVNPSIFEYCARQASFRSRERDATGCTSPTACFWSKHSARWRGFSQKASADSKPAHCHAA